MCKEVIAVRWRLFKPGEKKSAAPPKNRKKSKAEVLDKLCESADFLRFAYPQKGKYEAAYFKTLVDAKTIHEYVLTVLARYPDETLRFLEQAIPVEEMLLTDCAEETEKRLMSGSVMITEAGTELCLLVPCPNQDKRQIAPPESEYSVAGPKEAFVESLETNLNLIRKRLPIPELRAVELQAGSLSKTKVAVLYIEGIADQANADTVIGRIKDIEYDTIVDTTMISQLICDNPHSPFPQLVGTERPDRLASELSEGKIAIMADGTPHVLLGPSNIITFFSAFEDYFLPWVIASSMRLLRVFAICFSVLVTPLYVAVITYHYPVIPADLLPTLMSSRGGVPFPPILEALILETTIELLREASIRLPDKVGATIGIVGGIVIGTAAVEAGFVSNVLLMIVALAALSSFTAPAYTISHAIRLVRFPFLVAAQLYGLFGVSAASAFLLAHLLKLESLGKPYLAPFYPLRANDLKDSLIRFPFRSSKKRPVFLRPQQEERPVHAAETSRPDIDE